MTLPTPCSSSPRTRRVIYMGTISWSTVASPSASRTISRGRRRARRAEAMLRNLILTGGIGHPFYDAAPALRDVLAEAGITPGVTPPLRRGLAGRRAGGLALGTGLALC